MLSLVNRHGDELDDSQAVQALTRLAQLLEGQPLDTWEVRFSNTLCEQRC